MTARRGLAAATLLLVLAACRNEAPPAEPQQTPAATASDMPNLASFANGTVVVARTGELRLDTSTLHAIDDRPDSGWVTPPKDPEQSMTIALPVSSAIDRVGVTMGAGRPPASVTFEQSMDGTTFQPLAVLESPAPGREAFKQITPTNVSALRLTIAASGLETITINSISASGEENGSFVAPALTGSWTINGVPASFAQEGPSVRGVLQTQPPTLLEGAWSGRHVWFIYTRGNEYGLGAIAVSPDGSRLNGIWWYEKVKPLHIAPVWFGERTGEVAGPGNDGQVTEAWLARLGWAPLPGLEFDSGGSLRTESSESTLDWLEKTLRSPAGVGATLRKRDLSRATPEQGRASSASALESLRGELVRRGVDISGITFQPLAAEGLDEPSTGPIAHGLLNMVEIVLRKPAS